MTRTEEDDAGMDVKEIDEDNSRRLRKLNLIKMACLETDPSHHIRLARATTNYLSLKYTHTQPCFVHNVAFLALGRPRARGIRHVGG